MSSNIIPEFAVVGHPNEGKSSVVSTLAEDDSVRVSPVPGETIVAQTFPVIIDGKTILRFTDTPGFQNPRYTLTWMRNYTGADERIVEAFRNAHIGDPNFKDDCELFMPIARGAGIIYVIDGSRPVRSNDRAEMEVLRLTGRPRMAILNCKEDDTEYAEQWKNELRKHFNSVRIFNAHRATYSERIALLDTLKSIDQDWQKPLETVICAFKKDWEQRNTLTAELICDMLRDCLTYSMNTHFTDKELEDNIRKTLQENYSSQIEHIEKKAYQKIRELFKHNIFNYDLPPQSILNEPIFSQKTWHFLGLKPMQLAMAGGFAGGAVGAAIDVLAFAGVSMGLFVSLGTLLGASSALIGGKRMSKTKVSGMELGGYEMKIGPNENIQFMFILLDRALIFYSHVINWAHGRRDYPEPKLHHDAEPSKTGFTTEWDAESRKICQDFFKSLETMKSFKVYDDSRKELCRNALSDMLKGVLHHISQSERRYGLILKT